MKKFLVLMLVLGLTSAASAVMDDVDLSLNGGAAADITIDVGDTVLIDVKNNNTNSGIVYLYIGPLSLETLSDPDIKDAAGNIGWYTQDTWETYDLFEVGVADNNPGTPPDKEIGIVFDVVLTCDGTGDVDVYLYDVTEETLFGSMTITQVPEPMTIALLGLGGLFLRRRK